MKARDLSTPYPTVRMESRATEAARLLTEHNRPALVVVDEHDHPVAILPGSQVLRLLIPRYIQDDPRLAAVVDEEFADHLCDPLEEKTVAELLPQDRPALTIVLPDDNLLEIAAVMAANRSPLVAVVESGDKRAAMTGAITLSRLLSGLLPTRLTDS